MSKPQFKDMKTWMEYIKSLKNALKYAKGKRNIKQIKENIDIAETEWLVSIPY